MIAETENQQDANSVRPGLFNGRKVKCSPDQSKSNTTSKDDVYELNDGFVLPSTSLKFEVGFENKNDNTAECSFAHDNKRFKRNTYPLTPKFMVYQRVSSSNESLFTNDLDDYVTLRDDTNVRLEDIYPQFILPCMRIDKSARKEGHIKRLSKLLKWCGCYSWRIVNAIFSAEYRFDEVTTLHVLQGDTASETGVPDPIRKLRHRRAGCY